MADETKELSDEQMESMSGGSQSEIDQIVDALLANPKLAERYYTLYRSVRDEAEAVETLLDEDFDILSTILTDRENEYDRSLSDILSMIRNY